MRAKNLLHYLPGFLVGVVIVGAVLYWKGSESNRIKNAISEVYSAAQWGSKPKAAKLGGIIIFENGTLKEKLPYQVTAAEPAPAQVLADRCRVYNAYDGNILTSVLFIPKRKKQAPSEEDAMAVMSLPVEAEAASAWKSVRLAVQELEALGAIVRERSFAGTGPALMQVAHPGYLLNAPLGRPIAWGRSLRDFDSQDLAAATDDPPSCYPLFKPVRVRVAGEDFDVIQVAFSSQGLYALHLTPVSDPDGVATFDARKERFIERFGQPSGKQMTWTFGNVSVLLGDDGSDGRSPFETYDNVKLVAIVNHHLQDR